MLNRHQSLLASTCFNQTSNDSEHQLGLRLSGSSAKHMIIVEALLVDRWEIRIASAASLFEDSR